MKDYKDYTNLHTTTRISNDGWYKWRFNSPPNSRWSKSFQWKAEGGHVYVLHVPRVRKEPSHWVIMDGESASKFKKFIDECAEEAIFDLKGDSL